MAAAVFNDPELLFFRWGVLRVIRAVLRSNGIRGREDLEDAEQEVLIRCIKQVRATGRPPRDVPEAKAIARAVAQRYGIDELKKRVRQAKNIDRSKNDPDQLARTEDNAVNRIDAKRYASAVQGDMTDEQAKRLIDTQSMPQAKIARDDDVTVEAVRKETERTRRRARATLLAYGVATFAAAVGAVMFVHVGRWGDSGDVTKSQREYAAEQRTFAAQACKERKWDECKNALDRAAEADPEGERAAQVKRLREMVAAARGGSTARDGGGGGE